MIDSAFTRGTQDIAAEVQKAAAEPKVDGIVLEIASPGGEVFGVAEAWASIREAARAKPVVASVNSEAASAAYYLASAASEIVVTPSGMVGSVGVYSLHIDASKALEDMGEAWDFVVAKDSPFKVEGAPTGPLSAEAREAVQGHVDRYMAMFVRDVARGRSVPVAQVREGFGKGRMVGPEDAVAARMADRVGTFDDAIRRASAMARERREGAPAGGRMEHPMNLSIEEGPAPTPAVEEPAPTPEAGATDQERAAWLRLLAAV